jgi:UDP-GlcNAc:undecaprenyl-phosphate GlcNAc-1-phosphate transferase
MTAFLITVMTTPIVRKCALRWKLGDKPNGRKISTSMIPHLGGVAIVLGAVGGLAMVGVLAGDGGSSFKLLFQRMLPAVGLIVALGMVDDMKSLRAIQKLTIQLISAVVLAMAGFLLFTGIPVIDGSGVIVFVVSVIFLVGVSSSVNLIDGHDGLAAGISLLAFGAFAVMAVFLESSLSFTVSVALGGASLGFLVFNFPPGKIFMGDTGSMFLGVMLALVGCLLTMLKPTVHTFVAVCFVLGIPMLDAWLAIARRIILRSSPFQADCLHMHHVLRKFGLSPKQVLVVMYSMQVFLAVLGIFTLKGFTSPVVLGVTFIAAVYFSFLRVMVAYSTRERATEKLTAGSMPTLESNLPRQNTSLGR